VIFRTAHTAHALFDRIFYVPIPVCQLFRSLGQQSLQLLVALGLEDIAKNLPAFIGLGLQQFAEITLRNHGNLGELLVIQSQNCLNLIVYLLNTHEYPTVRHGQLDTSILLRHFIPTQCAALVSRVAANGVLLVAIAKYQFHIGRGLGIGVLGAQHGCIAVASAGLTVQCKGDCVKQRGLARAGVAGNQVQTVLPQLIQLQFRFSRVRPKRRHG